MAFRSARTRVQFRAHGRSARSKAAGCVSSRKEHGEDAAQSAGGLDENAVKPWADKAVDILLYLHGKDIAHLDVKLENMLVFGEYRNRLKVCDLESAAGFGEPRQMYVSPYICPPEVARHIVQGGADVLVSPKEDLWALGVTILYLLTGQHPFAADEGLSALAALSQDEVAQVLAASGKVKPASQLESFLQKCLAVEPSKRAGSAMEMKSSGWLSGASATQFVRDGSDKMDAMHRKVDAMHEEMSDSFQDLKISLGAITRGLEAVRKTIVNLDSSPVPCVFLVEMPTPEDKDSVGKQMSRGLGTLKRIFNPRSTKDQVQQAVAGKSLTLRLICQATGEPVGDGYVIKDP